METGKSSFINLLMGRKLKKIDQLPVFDDTK